MELNLSCNFLLSNCQVKLEYNSLAEFDPIWLIMKMISVMYYKNHFLAKNKKKTKVTTFLCFTKIKQKAIRHIFYSKDNLPLRPSPMGES